MKHTDVFGKPLKKEDVALAVQATVMHSQITTILLNRHTRLGIIKSANILRLLEQAKVVSAPKDGNRTVLIRNQAGALNAALRQINKGRR